jgi:cation transport ATPase
MEKRNLLLFLLLVGLCLSALIKKFMSTPNSNTLNIDLFIIVGIIFASGVSISNIFMILEQYIGNDAYQIMLYVIILIKLYDFKNYILK